MEAHYGVFDGVWWMDLIFQPVLVQPHISIYFFYLFLFILYLLFLQWPVLLQTVCSEPGFCIQPENYYPTAASQSPPYASSHFPCIQLHSVLTSSLSLYAS